MKIIDVLKRSSEKDHWKDALLWLGWALACGLLPIWITLLALILYQQNINLAIFTSNGEFMLYSASYLGGCLYLVIRDFKTKAFPNQGILGLSLVVLLVITAVVFSLLTTSNLLDGAKHNNLKTLLNTDAIIVISYIIFPVTMIISYLIIVTENTRQTIDIKVMSREQFGKLNEEFDKL